MLPQKQLLLLKSKWVSLISRQVFLFKPVLWRVAEGKSKLGLSKRSEGPVWATCFVWPAAMLWVSALWEFCSDAVINFSAKMAGHAWSSHTCNWAVGRRRVDRLIRSTWSIELNPPTRGICFTVTCREFYSRPARLWHWILFLLKLYTYEIGFQLSKNSWFCTFLKPSL